MFNRIFILRFSNKIISKLLGIISRLSGFIYTFNVRPNYNDYHTPLHLKKSTCSLILQGPLGDIDFLIDTLKIYSKAYPNSPLVVSTWIGVNKETARRLKSIPQVHLVESVPPLNPGAINVNMQITSTLAGLRYIENLNLSQYAIKTRTDQRIYSASIINFCDSLLKAFPLASDTLNQKQRIIGVSTNTSKYRPFSFSDIFQFGTIEDLLMFWTCPQDERSLPRSYFESLINDHKPLLEYVQAKFPEVYLMTEYIKKVNDPIEWTLSSYYSILKKRFIVINQSSIDLFWPKYSLIENNPEYAITRRWDTKMSFEDWITIQQNNITQIQVNEKILNEPM